MSEGRLKIMFISFWYPNRVKPLLGIFVKRHAAALTKVADVSALYVCADEKAGIEESNEEDIYTIRVYYKRVKHNIPLFSTGHKVWRYLRAWRKALRLYKLKKGKPDIVHSNIVYPVSLIAAYLKFKWKVPYIITEHWTGYLPADGRYKGNAMKFFSRIAVKYASAVTVVSEHLKKMMLEAKLDSIYYVVSNVVDTNLFKSSGKHDETGGTINFLHVSSLDDKQKNITGIIRTFTRVISDFPQARLTIIGPKRESEELQNLCQELNIKDSVCFSDYVMNEELVRVLNSAHAFVLFSNYETQAVVLLESICCGVPVITTKMEAIAEYVNPKNGILVDAGNEQQLYNAMVNMIKNANTYKPVEVRSTIVEKVNPEAVAQQFLNVYRNVLKFS